VSSEQYEDTYYINLREKLGKCLIVVDSPWVHGNKDRDPSNLSGFVQLDSESIRLGGQMGKVGLGQSAS
jgi:hypothetical protein